MLDKSPSGASRRTNRANINFLRRQEVRLTATPGTGRQRRKLATVLAGVPDRPDRETTCRRSTARACSMKGKIL